MRYDLNLFLGLLLSSTLFASCSDKGYRLENDNLVINNIQVQSNVSNLGNLVATALKEENNIDIALFPTELLPPDQIFNIKTGMKSFEIEELLNDFSSGVQDQFRIGVMKGSDIKALIFERSKERYSAALQVSGLKYHIHYKGGIVQYKNFEGDKLKFEDDRRYKVAVSEYFYFSGKTFPSYKYRNGLNRTLRDVGRTASVKESLRNYLLKSKSFSDLDTSRAIVTSAQVEDAGFAKISKIQGSSHISALYGQKVKTRGIVTAYGSVDWFPGGVEFYIQSKNNEIDNDPRTSEAVLVYSTDESLLVNIGDEVELTGVVYEDMSTSGLSQTMIRDLEKVEVISTKNILPDAVILGIDGVEIPSSKFSSYRGNLNNRESLVLSDAIDFYESLEGMRIKISSPRIVGFRGGNEDYEMSKPKGHLSLYIKADGDREIKNETSAGGVFINEVKDNHNPDILLITSSHLSKAIPTDYFYSVGQVLKGDVFGVMTYAKNLFGGGEFAIAIPEAQEAFTSLTSQNVVSKITAIEDRPKFESSISKEDSLTIASYNVENLGGHEDKRIEQTAKAISISLSCPDIVNLVEIQDFNGIDFRGGANADLTLSKLIKNIKCDDGQAVDYKYLNIDPTAGGEGGVPGGNIRVAMIYNSHKLSFTPSKNAPKPLDETILLKNGDISFNPGRVYANSDAFDGTRRSIVAQFTYKGRKVFVIGNHLNSKLGDSDMLGAEQPFVSGSEAKRIKLASLVNNFVQRIKKYNPDSYVFVMGDFNAGMEESSMKVMAGNELINTTRVDKLISRKDSYTTNHNGNSGSLDYIFMSKNIAIDRVEADVVHINSNYMGKLSDHDPVILRIQE